jgi:cytidylate kinase
VTDKKWEWNDAMHYDLTIDTSKLDVDKCVELILDYMKLVEITD